jgi:hypothetical protein
VEVYEVLADQRLPFPHIPPGAEWKVKSLASGAPPTRITVASLAEDPAALAAFLP